MYLKYRLPGQVMTKSGEAFSVYVVEDQDSVRKSLCALLESHDYKTIACETAESFLEAYDPAIRACLVLDLRLPGMSGLELQARLAEMNAKLPIIIVSAHGDVPVAIQAMRAGALDFLEKPAQIDQLLEAVEMAGALLFNRRPFSIPKKIVAERLSKLTERETEVLQFLLEGNLNKEIAANLGLSLRTVEVHRSRIREKMQARGIADLIRMLG